MPYTTEKRIGSAHSAMRGFSLVELMIAIMVFTIIMGAVITLLVKSQKIFHSEQGVSEMDQNARLLMDFLTRDVQQSKENGLGLGSRFRSIYSLNGMEGKTDEITVVSSAATTTLPPAALPLIAASTKVFSAGDKYVEVLPNGQGNLTSAEVATKFRSGEEFIISAGRQDGALQFDFIKISSAQMTQEGAIGLSFEPVEHKGIQPEVAFSSEYEGGAFTIRPVSVKRYFIDKADPEHPSLSLSVDGGQAIAISRNVVGFQLRYLEVKEGEIEGQWVNEQSISREFRTLAVEVTATSRTELGSAEGERLITLASVIRPRDLPSGDFGASPGNRSPSIPEGGWDGPGGNGNGDPTGGPGGPGSGSGNPGDGWGNGGGADVGSGPGGPGLGQGGYREVTRRIGKQPKLGERLNPGR